MESTPGAQCPLIAGLQTIRYVYQTEHCWLVEGYDRPEGPNIGVAGEHLTLMFLSLNRATLSERLCRSVTKHIPNFAGELLVIDNGSSPEELEKIRAMLNTIPCKSRIVELGRNHGVAGGRNRGMTQVRTDWVLSLDNDIYFTRNPLPYWQQELARIGCRFMTVPLFDPGMDTVFLRGGHIYLQEIDGQKVIGGGSTAPASFNAADGGSVFLGTCLMGGASIVHKQSFDKMGGYDDEMFIGFEDIEFSVRLFQEGYKVGCSNQVALVHDHPRPETSDDRSYEMQRFSVDPLKASALHFEKKHGFRVWNQNVEAWLKERHEALAITTESSSATASHQSSAAPNARSPSEYYGGGRPKVLLVSDVSGWAFSNIAHQIRKHLSNEFDIEITTSHELDSFGQIALLAQSADLIHFFWRADIRSLFGSPVRQYANNIGYKEADWMLDHILVKRCTTSIYDHLHLDESGVAWMRPVIESFVDAYTVSSLKLDDIYRRLFPSAPPSLVAQDGVDLERFKPRERPTGRSDSEPLVLGWVGNSKWAAELEDFKGLHTIIEPAVRRLRADGMSIETKWCDKHVKYTPHVLMPNYYASIDLLICASKIEGTPNPVLEAMASGVPIVSTDVGIVPEVFGPLQRQLILRHRSVDDLVEAIRKLHQDRGMLRQCRAENLCSIRTWNWSHRVEAFRTLFRETLSREPRRKQALS